MPINYLKKFWFEIVILFLFILMYKENSPAWYNEWINPDSFYGLGLFVIGFIIYFIKTNYAEIKEIPKSSSPWGIVMTVIGAFLYIVGTRARLEYFVSFSLPVIVSGIILSIYGLKTFFKILMPLILFTLILPIFPLHRITMPLQMISTKFSCAVLNLLGINAASQGSILIVEHIRMSIVAGCSGLKSIFSLLFVTIISTYLENVKLPKKILYIALVLPFAVFMNMIRIVITAFYGIYNGYATLETFHDYAGIVVNIISIIIIIHTVRSFEKREEPISID